MNMQKLMGRVGLVRRFVGQEEGNSTLRQLQGRKHRLKWVDNGGMRAEQQEERKQRAKHRVACGHWSIVGLYAERCWAG